METWKPLRNFPSYDGSTDGRIMNIKTQRVLKTFTNEHGYKLVCLRKNGKQYTVKVAKVIAETFIGECPGLDISYKNGDRSDCCVDNLEWRTRSETILAAFDRGIRVPPRQIAIRVVETGELYPSIRSCARAIDCCQNDISGYFAGKRSSVKGYHFEYA